jgi:hypothetical protein
VTSYIAEKRGMQDFDGRMIRECHAGYDSSSLQTLTVECVQSTSKPSSRTSRSMAPCRTRPTLLAHRWVSYSTARALSTRENTPCSQLC